jgi:hypothetical protein
VWVYAHQSIAWVEMSASMHALQHGILLVDVDAQDAAQYATRRCVCTHLAIDKALKLDEAVGKPCRHKAKRSLHAGQLTEKNCILTLQAACICFYVAALHRACSGSTAQRPQSRNCMLNCAEDAVGHGTACAADSTATNASSECMPH